MEFQKIWNLDRFCSSFPVKIKTNKPGIAPTKSQIPDFMNRESDRLYLWNKYIHNTHIFPKFTDFWFALF